MLKLNTIPSDEINGKVIIVRVDLNVPVDDKGCITDDTRIICTLPTIKYLTSNGGKVILISHFGRPDPCFDNNGNKLKDIIETDRLPEQIISIYSDNGLSTTKLNYCIGDKVTNDISTMNNGELIILENVRFYEGECLNDETFAQNLANSADIFVMDAFGTSHRKHASTFGVQRFIDTCVTGYLMEKEIYYLDMICNAKNIPVAAVIGGSKISTKMKVIKSLLNKCDKIFIGGGMANTFLKAKGFDVGSSLVENDMLEEVINIEETATKNNVKLLLPVDAIISKTFSNDSQHRIINLGESCDEWMILDIGPKTAELFKKELFNCETVIWNGPMGVFELENFSFGTKEIAYNLAEKACNGTNVIIGGGDSVSAVNKFDIADKITHISTGGGAMLEYLS